MQGVSESKTEKGCYGTMLDSLQLMAKHPVYLENNVAVLWFFCAETQKLGRKINMEVEQNMGIMKARCSPKEVVCCPRVWARHDFNQRDGHGDGMV